jgi:hypothetical protein
LADLFAEPNRDLHTVVGGLVEQQHEHLPSKHLMLYLLVDKVRNECRRRKANSLVIPLVTLPELHDQPLDQELSNLRQLRVYNRRHRRIDGCEGQTRRLRFHDRSTKQASSSDQVLAKQLRHDVLDVRRVDLVDQTVDTLLQRLPRHALILLARLIGDLGL